MGRIGGNVYGLDGRSIDFVFKVHDIVVFVVTGVVGDFVGGEVYRLSTLF